MYGTAELVPGVLVADGDRGGSAGDGSEALTCPQCGGTGAVAFADFGGIRVYAGVIEDCPQCGGSGRIDREPECERHWSDNPRFWAGGY